MSQARDLGDAANKANFLDNVTADIQPQLTPAGTIIAFGGATAPTGYLACDGSAVSRTTYATLFAAIGTTWGSGDGSSTFKLPDLRGAFLRGTGSHGTENMANGNDFAGPSVGDFENDQFQGHAHQQTLSGNSSGGDNTNVHGPSFSRNTSEGNEATTFGTPRVGDETRPFNAGVMYCIKT